MGEEKPDEELMGKRKSSPRLSTTLVVSIIIEWPKCFLFIHVKLKKMSFDVLSDTERTSLSYSTWSSNQMLV